MAIRNSVGSVGCIRSRSSFESKAGERPVCLLNSGRPMLLRRRSRLNFAPMAYLPSPSAMAYLPGHDLILRKISFTVKNRRKRFFLEGKNGLEAVAGGKQHL